jgi:hypothetical protein
MDHKEIIHFTLNIYNDLNVQCDFCKARTFSASAFFSFRPPSTSDFAGRYQVGHELPLGRFDVLSSSLASH